MKEKLYTIPLNDAVNADDECPFCFIERKLEQDLMDFVLGSGSSYMESDIRSETDKAGFCRPHFKKMFDYGNSLGNAWILKTHYRKMIDEMNKEFKNFKPGKPAKKGLFAKPSPTDGNNSIVSWIKEKECSCYICNNVQNTFNAYLKTFFTMYTKDEGVREKFFNTKGVCLSHFANLMEGADQYLNEKEQTEFYERFLPLQSANMERLYEDISWFIEKYDYKNKDADWKDSKDAVQRGMMKMKGTDPSLPPYQLKR